jgi:hypothetical protein
MRVLAVLLAVVIGVAACDGNGAAFIAGSPTGTCIREFQVSPRSAIRHSGDTLQLSATAICSPNTFDTIQIHWRSSDTLIAYVDSLSGFAQARSRGVATITAFVVADQTLRESMVLTVLSP